MEKPEATLSMLLMSIASSALTSMGHAPNPENKTEIDKNMARFNIDLLLMIKEKTKNNLTLDEQNFLTHITQDLQNKFLNLK